MRLRVEWWFREHFMKDSHFSYRSLIVLVVFNLLGMAAQVPTHIAEAGETRVMFSDAQNKVRVTIRTHEVQNGTPAKPHRPKDSACTMSRMPCSVVDAIEIDVDGRSVFTPRSSFCDLADVTTSAIERGGKGWVLTLDGGDASASYVVKVEFNNTRVVHRTMWSGLDSSDKLQETTYYPLKEIGY